MSPHLICAIADDGTQYPVEKMEAHRQAIQHWAISVFVFSGDQLLLQQRSKAKYHCGGLWANTCCSHPDWLESLDVSAKRRLREELGLSLNLKPGGVFDYSTAVTEGLWENERVQTFYARVDSEALAFDPDPAEVSDVRWASLSEIKADIHLHPDRYAPWFRIYTERWPELGLGI